MKTFIAKNELCKVILCLQSKLNPIDYKYFEERTIIEPGWFGGKKIKLKEGWYFYADIYVETSKLEKDLSVSDIVIIGKELYSKPKVTLYMRNTENVYKVFDTYQEAFDYADKIKNEYGLLEIE